jgi:hypothetical protein
VEEAGVPVPFPALAGVDLIDTSTARFTERSGFGDMGLLSLLSPAKSA